MAEETTSLYTPKPANMSRRSPILGSRAAFLFGREALLSGGLSLFTPGYKARPLLTQDGLTLITQAGRTLTIQGRASS